MSFYINGVLADSASMGGGNITQLNANLARFGCGFYWTDPDLSGSIDELRIWNTPLSASTISNSFMAGPDNLPTPGYVPPTISSIADTTILSDASPGPIAFTVTAGTIPIQGIAVSGSSSSQTLVPNANVVIGGSGNNRTVMVTPAAGQYGTATITVSAFDGSTTANRTFQLKVNITQPNPSLLHRWSFAGNGLDTIGAANATLVGAATYSGNQFAGSWRCCACQLCDCQPEQYVRGKTQVFSIETWFTIKTNQDWSKVWMFGRNTGSQPSLCNLSFTPRIGSAGNFPKIEIDPPTLGEISTIGGASDPGVMTTNVEYHVVTVYDTLNDTMSFYINGVLADSASMGGFNITQLNINECYFGAPVFYPDPNFNGSINEVRVWNGPLSPTRISQNYTLGPDSVQMRPQIAAQPVNVTVVQGGNTNFSVTATGSATLAYQWQLAGVNLGGATSSTLTLNNVQAAQAGNYTVIVTNNFGSVTSSVATLTVTNVPTSAAKLLHRWSFTTDGTDSVGGANATLVGQASYSGGKLVLPGGGTFANYATVGISNTLATHPNITVETWFTINSLRDWSKVWMFGHDNAGGEPGLSYINFTPRAGGVGAPPKVDFDPVGSGEVNTLGGANPGPLAAGTAYHVVVSFDAANNVMSFYTNGVLADSAAMGGGSITNLQADVSRFGAGFSWPDADLNGLIDEMRIWDGVLGAGAVTSNYLAGADVVTGLAIAPQIVSQPTNQTVLAGNAANFSVTASGSAPLTYQWRLAGIKYSRSHGNESDDCLGSACERRRLHGGNHQFLRKCHQCCCHINGDSSSSNHKPVLPSLLVLLSS